MSSEDSDIDLKFDEMDHILDQIASYTNQGMAQIFVKKICIFYNFHQNSAVQFLWVQFLKSLSLLPEYTSALLFRKTTSASNCILFIEQAIALQVTSWTISKSESIVWKINFSLKKHQNGAMQFLWSKNKLKLVSINLKFETTLKQEINMPICLKYVIFRLNHFSVPKQSKFTAKNTKGITNRSSKLQHIDLYLLKWNKRWTGYLDGWLGGWQGEQGWLGWLAKVK